MTILWVVLAAPKKGHASEEWRWDCAHAAAASPSDTVPCISPPTTPGRLVSRKQTGFAQQGLAWSCSSLPEKRAFAPTPAYKQTPEQQPNSLPRFAASFRNLLQNLHHRPSPPTSNPQQMAGHIRFAARSYAD